MLGLALGLGLGASSLRPNDEAPELDSKTLACVVDCAAFERPTDRVTCRLQCGLKPGEIDPVLLDQLDACYEGCRDEPAETDEVTCRLQCASDFYARLR